MTEDNKTEKTNNIQFIPLIEGVTESNYENPFINGVYNPFHRSTKKNPSVKERDYKHLGL